MQENCWIYPDIDRNSVIEGIQLPEKDEAVFAADFNGLYEDADLFLHDMSYAEMETEIKLALKM